MKPNPQAHRSMVKEMLAAKSETMDVNTFHIKSLESIDDLNNEFCRALYVHWDSLIGTQDYDSFGLVDVPLIVPFLLIIDVEETSGALQFRMIGSEIVSVTADDLTGRVLTGSSVEAPLTRKFCEAAIAARRPVYTSDCFDAESLGSVYRFEETVALPLFSSDGKLNCILMLHGPRK